MHMQVTWQCLAAIASNSGRIASASARGDRPLYLESLAQELVMEGAEPPFAVSPDQLERALFARLSTPTDQLGSWSSDPEAAPVTGNNDMYVAYKGWGAFFFMDDLGSSDDFAPPAFGFDGSTARPVNTLTDAQIDAILDDLPSYSTASLLDMASASVRHSGLGSKTSHSSASSASSTTARRRRAGARTGASAAQAPARTSVRRHLLMLLLRATCARADDRKLVRCPSPPRRAES